MPEPLTPAQRSLRGSVAANTRWANATREQRHAQGVTMRANSPASLGYWEAKIDPDDQLDADERARRAGSARKAYFQRLAYASSKARSRGGDGNAVA